VSVHDDAHAAGTREADRLGPIRDPDVLARVARILRSYATHGRANDAPAVKTDTQETIPPDAFQSR
jgi:hypothetical protein